MIIDFKYAYFVLTIPFILIWVLLFIFSKKTRKEQLILSILLIPLGTIGEIFYFQDYWQPAGLRGLSHGELAQGDGREPDPGADSRRDRQRI